MLLRIFLYLEAYAIWNTAKTRIYQRTVWFEGKIVLFLYFECIDFLISGLGLILPVSLYKTLSSCQNGNSGLSDSLKNIRITGLLTAKGLKFLYPHGTNVPLQATVKCKSEDSESVRIPDPLTAIEQATRLKLEEIAYDTGIKFYVS